MLRISLWRSHRGYAAFDPSEDSDLKETMKRADVRMYERKKQLKAQKSTQN